MARRKASASDVVRKLTRSLTALTKKGKFPGGVALALIVKTCVATFSISSWVVDTRVTAHVCLNLQGFH